MSLAASTSETVDIVKRAVGCIERYVADQRASSDKRLAASSLLALCQCILAALNEIQNSLHLDGWETESTEGGSAQSLSSVLASCQITFKILVDTVQHATPMAPGTTSSSTRATNPWP